MPAYSNTHTHKILLRYKKDVIPANAHMYMNLKNTGLIERLETYISHVPRFSYLTQPEQMPS